MCDINTCRPGEILHKLAIIFETSREERNLSALQEGLELPTKVEISPFNILGDMLKFNIILIGLEDQSGFRYGIGK